MSDPSIVHALILGAGLGTRLRPITDVTPKVMVEIGGFPLLGWWASLLESVGVRAALVNTHHLRPKVSSYLAQLNAVTKIRWFEGFESELLGSAGTVAAHPAFMDGADTGLIIYGDNYSEVNLRRFVHAHEASGAATTAALFRTSKPRECGIVQLDGNGFISEITEKPTCPKSNLAFAGLLAVSPAAYREMAEGGGADLARDVLPRWCGRVHGHLLTEYHLDVGTLAALQCVEARVSLREILPRKALAICD